MIEEILDIAVNAPSGHNSQPWKFQIKNEQLFIWNVPDKDKILFNYEQRGSLIANGALIENIYIVASEKGFEMECQIFPELQKENLVAQITFKKKNSDYKYQYLYPQIKKRTTNRRPFEQIKLKAEDSSHLTKFIAAYSNNILLTENPNTIKEVSGPFSVGDRLLFENKYIHHDLFSNVNWTLKEELEKREGLYLMTKEMSLPNRLFFKYGMSNWNVLLRLNRIGFSEKAGEKRKKLYEHCSALGLITYKDDSRKSFVEAGRLVQRTWLYATSLGLSFQPVSIGLLYLGQMCQKETPPELSSKQVELVKNAYSKILSTFNIREIPMFSFRIGYALPPTASSVKKKPDISYI